MSGLPPHETDLTRAHALPAHAYTDPALYALERERIFGRTWQPVGNAADVRHPGDFFTSNVAGEPIVVTRDAGGTLRAFYNVCRHRAGPVAEGKGSRHALQCKYHGWTYDLDGKLRTTPELGAAPDFDPACNGLVRCAVEAFGPFIFVNLDADAAPLAPSIPEMAQAAKDRGLDTMASVGRREYEIACNWKVYVDNYLEGYHLPHVHPGLFRELDYNAYRVETRELHSSQIAPIRPPDVGHDRKHPRQYRHANQGDEALYFWAFPNWMLNVYPDNMSINIVVPLSIDRTLTIFEWFLVDRVTSDPRSETERAMAFSDAIQQEDIEICEAVQRGLQSRGYPSGGKLSAARENGVHHFQGLVGKFLSRN
mgnify:CR=1 FL=1